MGVIFDSCIWVGMATGQLQQNTILKLVAEQPIFTSVISLGELQYGVESCLDPAERAVRAAYLRQVENRPILDISEGTAAAFGILAAAVKHSGRSPRQRYNDLWLAAQAIQYGYGLLTLNRADFSDLPGLRLLPISE